MKTSSTRKSAPVQMGKFVSPICTKKNGLVLPRFETTLSFRSRNKRMSILTGIICPDAIIVATDSRLTDIQTGEYMDNDKITVIEMRYENILVASGGREATAQQVLEIIKEKSKWAVIKNKKTVVDILKKSIAEYKGSIDEDVEKQARSSPTFLLVAFFAEKEPHLLEVEIFGDINEVTGKYHSFSVNSDWTNYLLKEFAEPQYGAGFTLASIVDIIAKPKDHNSLCGGRTNVKWLWPVPSGLYGDDEPRYIGRANKMNDEFLERFELRLPELRAKVKAFRNQQLAAMIKEISEQVEADRKKLKG